MKPETIAIHAGYETEPRTKSVAVHPASTIHCQLNDVELAAASVTPDMIRHCIGIEHIDDIIVDIEQALRVSTGIETLNNYQQ